MNQAPTIATKQHKDPAAATLRVVHSLNKSEEAEVPAKEISIKEKQSPRTAERHPARTKPHYGRSYHPDGPAGNYQGL